MGPSDAHARVQEYLGVYSLDAVDPGERRFIEAHVAACAECTDEVAAHLVTAASLAGSDHVVPAGAWDDISSKLRRGPRVRGEGGPISLRGRLLVAVAAVVVVFAGAGAAVLASRSDVGGDPAATSLTDDAEFAATVPGAQVVTLSSNATDQRASVVLSPDGSGFVLHHTLDPLPPGSTYQLWVVMAGKVLSAGILGPDPGVIAFHVDPGRVEALVITAETAGGVVVSDQPAIVAWGAS